MADDVQDLRQTFRATLALDGKTATGIAVPDEIVAALGPSKRPRVLVTINGHAYRSSIGRMGGEYKLLVSAKERAAAGIAAGDVVDVTLEPDESPRTVTAPADLAAALAPNEAATAVFDGLSYSQQHAFVVWIESAKTTATRERRVAETVTLLREGRKTR